MRRLISWSIGLRRAVRVLNMFWSWFVYSSVSYMVRHETGNLMRFCGFSVSETTFLLSQYKSFAFLPASGLATMSNMYARTWTASSQTPASRSTHYQRDLIGYNISKSIFAAHCGLYAQNSLRDVSHLPIHLQPVHGMVVRGNQIFHICNEKAPPTITQIAY